MKKIQTLSFHLHWITLCCFLLPFFYDSCANEKKPDETIDSATVVIPVDTISKDSDTEQHLSPDSLTTISSDTTSASTTQKDEFLSETIIKKYSILKPILIPASDTHTGLATIINTFQFISVFATTITFLLLLIGLLAKLIDKNAVKIFFLLEIFAMIFLLIASPPFFAHDRLWGYWFCLLCISILTIIDAYIIYKQKRKEI